ncbi:hypothetical protein PPL_04107 [Heterostelium album PN500]|uniref:Chitinase n=1 Tax=Heterostelium pallidum (strain ATCC 26659 / Pp 5 / PN500) TaxID=670386 RepID=D3B619_HETP5|nr:hypothetical protein PPL_04107 [Heterostelium album PN500]EFA83317.1 hypothetical protein PPL_04107 [Heterostelium album PN500]|eukprot:XP_020435434.1 hypothetical protein PPL_04107 [Heterostelium album PN500]
MKFLLVSLVLLVFCLCNLTESKNGVMPWMGLERTNESISDDLQQIESIQSLLTLVAYERFNLGPNSTLINNNFTNVLPNITSYGLKGLSMISTYPWGRPETIEWCRQLFENPQPFIDSAIQYSLTEGFYGYNVDIEPIGGNEDDAVAYAEFIDSFSRQMHQHNKILTVAAATYDPFWNLTLLGQTEVDLIFTMSTYTSNITTFTKNLNFAIDSIPLERLAIGLETVDNNNNPYPSDQLALRFDLIEQANINNIGIWSSPLPDNWLPFLKQYVSNTL